MTDALEERDSIDEKKFQRLGSGCGRFADFDVLPVLLDRRLWVAIVEFGADTGCSGKAA